MVSQLFILAKSITDLTGIEDFAALTSLFCASNQLTSLDVSQNAALINLDFSYNQVISLDVSQNAAIEGLTCNSNQLTILDVSQNPALEFLACKDNQLSCLNVKNGNNPILSNFYAINNPNLTCIEVDDVTYSNTNWVNPDFTFDTQSSFSTNCPDNCITFVAEHIPSFMLYPNPVGNYLVMQPEQSSTLTLYNAQGQLLITKEISTTCTLNTSHLSKGIYYLRATNERGSYSQKVVKE